MRLYLLRHGDAEDTADRLSDEARALTPTGFDEVRTLARTLRARGESFDLIWCSSLVRAVQTAQIVAEGLSYRGPLRALLELIPGGDPLEAVELARAEGGSVLLVGHEPQMTYMAAYALGRLRFPPKNAV
ncbi:MAG: phosphohistidine phosphatase SixA, partial [Myxococcales bacterium]